ncbi:hypothetical protein PQD71_gp130 [Kosakonia phage Kc263]|uniref:Uncharacterized protein n=1 Tax=Kosakonia phage Kc263 TaxID=2863194 RepID=A0AAE7WFP3_9CAUD|nr:hypothetical protein PQD71_gp130 [Kosakonia phage Kc263]QYN80023.1 hypothetical protein [Kosakonia phage Kc263]
MNERTKGTVPISVGTALAFEVLPGTDMKRYHSLLINLRTIVRNARQAYDQYTPTVNELFQACKEDIVGLAEFIVSMKLKTDLELKLYYPSYRGLPRLFPLAKLKNVEREGTEKQKAIHTLEKNVLDKLLVEFDKGIIKVDSTIPPFAGQALIITHHAVDLVTSESYSRLNLLESHTGTIKNYTLFYTKLTGSDKLTNIPLSKLTIQIFGDNSTNFYAHSIAVKNEIKQLAEAARWSTASPPGQVARSIRSLNNSPEKDILLKMI